jgi:hypothetical protein
MKDGFEVLTILAVRSAVSRMWLGINPTFRSNLSPPFSGLKGKITDNCRLLSCWACSSTAKMEAICSSETMDSL